MVQGIQAEMARERTMFMNRKRTALLVVCALFLFLLAGCGPEAKEDGAAETYAFTDSAGRKVNLPKQIDRIAPSGGLAQAALFAIAPDKLVGISSPWKDSALSYVGEKYSELPVFGQFYGMKNFNKEAVLAANPQVIIDVGEKRRISSRIWIKSRRLSAFP